METNDLESAEDADSVLAELAGAGLAIVDAELHRALVDVVRARQWFEANRTDVAGTVMWEEAAHISWDAYRRAVELLARDVEAP